MTHWGETAVTDTGNEMLNEQMAGRFLTVTAAYGGTGLVDAGILASQTALKEKKQTLSITNDETTSAGRMITIQVTNADAEYELNQIGLFAKLDVARNPDAEEKMLCIMQDRQEKGAIIVPSTADPTFVLELYCTIKITNNGRFEVTIDKTGIVNIAHLERKIAEHSKDGSAHQDIRDELAALETQTKLEIGTVTISNQQAYPFPGAGQTVDLKTDRKNTDYTVVVEVESAVGNVQAVEVYDKATNGFKVRIDGSASEAKIKYYVSGGM